MKRRADALARALKKGCTRGPIVDCFGRIELGRFHGQEGRSEFGMLLDGVFGRVIVKCQGFRWRVGVSQERLGRDLLFGLVDRFLDERLQRVGLAEPRHNTHIGFVFGATLCPWRVLDRGQETPAE